MVLTALFLAGCEKATEWPLENNQTDYMVVEGTITNEEKFQNIRLARPMQGPDNEPEAIGNAGVLVSTEDRVYRFTEDPSEPGTYRSEEAFAGKPGKTYSLIINHNGKIVSAKTGMAPAADFVFLRYVRQSGTDLFRIVWVANPYNAKRPAMYEILLDWSAVPGYEQSAAEDTRARLLYYTLPTLDVSQVFAPAMEKVLFPPGTVITERRYSLTASHAAYLRALLSETNWQGGLFGSSPANLPTNLSGAGIGFFGACAVTTKTETARNIFR